MLSYPAVLLGAGELGADDFLLLLVFVTNVKVTALGARNQAGQNHALDYEMRHLGEDEAVFNGPRLALIGIANNVFFRRARMAHMLPLLVRGIASAPHAAEPGSLYGCQ